MIKLQAINGIASDHIIKCVKAMECSSRRRAKGQILLPELE